MFAGLRRLPANPHASKRRLSAEKTLTIVNEHAQKSSSSNLKTSQDSSDEFMTLSRAELTNTVAFFEGEIKICFKMLDRMSEINKQKEKQCANLQVKVKEYESQIERLKKTAVEFTTMKAKSMVQKEEEKDEKKTRKRLSDDDTRQIRGLSRNTSEFTLERVLSDGQERPTHDAVDNIQKHQIERLKEKIEGLNKELKNEQERVGKLNEKIAMQTVIYERSQYQSLKFEKEKTNMQAELDSLQKRYNELENKHGKTVTEYQLKINNLQSMLKGINRNVYLKKDSEKNKEGYWSINKPLNKKGSSQEMVSSDSDNQFTVPSLAQMNLMEENDYLRSELIRVLDQKAKLFIKINKYQKIAAKYQNLIQVMKEQESSNSSNSETDTNRSLYKFNKSKDIYKSEQSFKKKRENSILLIEKTKNEQNAIIDDQTAVRKIVTLFKDINRFVKSNNSFENASACFSEIDMLQKTLEKIKNYESQISNLQMQNQLLAQQNNHLETQKKNYEEKLKQDEASLKKYLQNQKVKFTTPKSADSTDKAFENISLSENEKYQQEIQRSQIMLKEQLGSQKNQLSGLKEIRAKPSNSFSKISEEESNPKKSSLFTIVEETKNLKASTSPEDPKNLIQEEECLAITSQYETFKQTMTDFYTNTMRILDDWSESQREENNLSSIQQDPSENESHLHLRNSIKQSFLKLSMDLQSIQDSSFDHSTIMKNEEYGNQVFGNLKLNKSILGNESECNFESQSDIGSEIVCKSEIQSQIPSDHQETDTFENVIKKKLQDFNEFSSNLIQKNHGLEVNLEDVKEKIQEEREMTDKQRKELEDKILKKFASFGQRTERQTADRENNFEVHLNEVDAETQWMSEAFSNQFSEHKSKIEKKVNFYEPYPESAKSESYVANDGENGKKILQLSGSKKCLRY